MARREGEIVWPSDKELDSCIHIAGANTCDQRLEDQIAADDLQHKTGQDCRSGLSILWHKNENTGEKDPDQAVIAQRGDGRHQKVHDGIPQICLDPVQNGQFKREHSYHLVSLVVLESSAGFRDDPQWPQY